MARTLTPRRVAVVGAGIAGLTAAQRLTRAGVKVAVFDKSRRPGGRTSTRRTDALAFDHGAQYFTCRDESFADQVRDWCARGVAARWKAPVVGLSGGSVSRSRGPAARYVGVPSMSALARDLAGDLWVECERRIERVERGAGGWRLVCEDGAVFVGFDAVVIAVPAPQAVDLLAPLPKMAERLAGLEMQACHALMVSFAEPLDVTFGGAFVEDPALAWIALDGSKPGRMRSECWVLHTTPEWSAANLATPEDAAASELLEALAKAVGRKLAPVRFVAMHRWRYARTAGGLGAPCLWDDDAKVGVCGDWCLGARVEDAYRSGDHLARRLLEGEQAGRPSRVA